MDVDRTPSSLSADRPCYDAVLESSQTSKRARTIVMDTGTAVESAIWDQRCCWCGKAAFHDSHALLCLEACGHKFCSTCLSSEAYDAQVRRWIRLRVLGRQPCCPVCPVELSARDVIAVESGSRQWRG
eukprot:gnl/TRDRNA2_/TRDRNA2_198808_c0_seq1.p1 gnl/TRDRNA2_/TRDRNA2_198808_c0~~gnl/TRDRNA2_/TRDRNA2_198808_c0_seq1.p1  ORF type:complete len:128 (-),score=7.90 gnl/TRDRNA2_/TRDRNA2_198808_c0_seq1:25-408(-)